MTTRYSTSAVTPQAKADSLVVKATAGNLYHAAVVMDQTDGTTKRCVMLFDSATLPANGTDPLYRFVVLGSLDVRVDFKVPLHFATGIVMAISSTWDDLTVTTADEGFLSAVFD